MKESTHVKDKRPVPLSVFYKDPQNKLDLPKKHYNALNSILQKHYLKNQDICQVQLDKYAFDNFLPEMKVVRDEDKSAEKTVTFIAAIDDCLSKLNGVKWEDIRQIVSEMFLEKKSFKRAYEEKEEEEEEAEEEEQQKNNDSQKGQNLKINNLDNSLEDEKDNILKFNQDQDKQTGKPPLPLKCLSTQVGKFQDDPTPTKKEVLSQTLKVPVSSPQYPLSGNAASKTKITDRDEQYGTFDDIWKKQLAKVTSTSEVTLAGEVEDMYVLQDNPATLVPDLKVQENLIPTEDLDREDHEEEDEHLVQVACFSEFITDTAKKLFRNFISFVCICLTTDCLLEKP
jgi:hypothetical protein